MKNIKYITAILIFTLFTACDLEVEPSDKLTIEKLLSNEQGLEVATNGNYALLKDHLRFRGGTFEDPNNSYVRHLYQMSEFAADNVMYTQFSSDPLYIVFTRNHFEQQENSAYLWFIAYRIILGANLIIESASEGRSDEEDQLIGENYFLRAMAEFDLLRFYAFPYSHGTSNPGIVIRTGTSEAQTEARATVGESYQQVIDDLLKAESLMNKSRGVQYASKEAAWALLSRAYLYMEEDQLAIDYADKVIDSGKFTLASQADYMDNFANTPNSPESIFIIKHVANSGDSQGRSGSVGSMYYNDGNGGGWGEVFVSQPFLDLIQANPSDIRNDLIQIPGGTKNTYPIRYVIKFTGQDGVVNLSSPQVLRLSEMYLNRAESNAKLGNDAAAIADVNIIRERAGLTGAALYSVGSLGGRSALDIALEERRLELAYEGHRSFDQYRNKRDMNRSYEGIHLEVGETTQIIPFDDNRNIFFIPLGEINANPACEQNN